MTFDKEYFNLGYLDALSYQDTFVHRLDPRAKLLAMMFLYSRLFHFLNMKFPA